MLIGSQKNGREEDERRMRKVRTTPKSHTKTKKAREGKEQEEEDGGEQAKCKKINK